ncbi:MAG: phosphomevalonate kinase [Candidatus Melainabacteria bacterium HGW-Melainabacteria-1]|nr:MAG: phosphomevalonate kinase [Candidatus Melainabacteria bacterium HGW-Melainabacteria-1]
MTPLRVRVPGKLMLAGEYAILEPGALALVLAVDRYLRVELIPAPDYRLCSDLAPDWVYEPSILATLNPPPELGFAVAALQLGWQYLQAELLPLGPFSLQLSSELHTEQRKLGLGSSAAVCVGVLAALLAAAGRDLADPQIRAQLYKLALIAHRGVQGSGSGADIAASIFGSVTAYTCPDLDRLPLQAPLDKLLSLDWPMLALAKLPWPVGWRLYFGWTGAAAHTAELIEDYRRWRRDDPDGFAEFSFDAATNSMGLGEALRQADPDAFAAGISRARRQLQRMGEEWPEPPETPALAALADAAEVLGGAGKFSGAGGGDCGLAWVDPSQAEALFSAWQAAGIEPLDLDLDTLGVCLDPVFGG